MGPGKGGREGRKCEGGAKKGGEGGQKRKEEKEGRVGRGKGRKLEGSEGGKDYAASFCQS